MIANIIIEKTDQKYGEVKSNTKRINQVLVVQDNLTNDKKIKSQNDSL